MRKLIADSGSTKTDWVKIIENDSSVAEFEAFSCRGLNPHFLTSDEIEIELRSVGEALGNSFDQICFYGAGIGNPQMVRKIEECVSNVFDCPDIKADSDIEGAAQAVLGDTPGIACIMGTGSNSCHYNGTNIDRKAVSLGYILDDNGGGVAFGRRLISDVFKGLAPSEIIDVFQKKYDLTVPEIVNHVYSRPSANRWIAGFMPFILEQKDHPYISNLIKTQIKIFLDREFHIYTHKELKEEGIGFVGSVAHLLSDEITEELESRGWKSRGILRKPLDKLTHINENL